MGPGSGLAGRCGRRGGRGGLRRCGCLVRDLGSRRRFGVSAGSWCCSYQSI